MSIKQISIFLENRPGSLAELLGLLGDAGVDLIALSIADTTDFGILRAIVNDTEKTLDLVKENGYTAKLNNVLAVAVPDTPGGLAGALNLLYQNGISVEYLYSFVRRINHQAVIIFRVDKPEEAQALLAQNNLHLLSHEEIVATCCP